MLNAAGKNPVAVMIAPTTPAPILCINSRQDGGIHDPWKSRTGMSSDRETVACCLTGHVAARTVSAGTFAQAKPSTKYQGISRWCGQAPGDGVFLRRKSSHLAFVTPTIANLSTHFAYQELFIRQAQVECGEGGMVDVLDIRTAR